MNGLILRKLVLTPIFMICKLFALVLNMRPSSNMLKLGLLLLSVTPTLFIVSCAQLDDPHYAGLAMHVETNPDPQSIVGMWHRTEKYGPHIHHYNVLFKSDYTGVTKATTDYPNSVFGKVASGNLSVDMGAFTWTYNDKGVWTMSSKQRQDNCRISNGKLLREFHFAGLQHWVFERVN